MLTKTFIQECVDKFKSLNVLVVGDVISDHYIIGSASRISREAPVPILDVDTEFSRMGGAGNVAVNAASLGAKVSLVAPIGANDYGLGLGSHCTKHNINAKLLPYLPRTIRKTRMLAGNQQLLRVDWEDRLVPTDKQKNEIFSVMSGLLDDCDVVVVSDYAKGMVFGDLINQIIDSGKPIIVDPKPCNKKHYVGVTLVTPNYKEALDMVGVSGGSPEMLSYTISGNLLCDVLVTLGGDGMCLFGLGQGGFSKIPTMAKEVCDVTGAGDTVVAVMALCIGAGVGMYRASDLANLSAGIVVSRMGTAWVTPEELVATGRSI